MAQGLSQAMLMRLVLVGRPSKEWRVIGGRPWGRVWAWRTAGIQPAQRRLTREGEKRASERGESKESEREEDRRTDFIMQG